MALTVYNDTQNGVRVWVALIWSLRPGSSCGGGFTTHRKTGWWRVDDGFVTTLWTADLNAPQVNPVGAFFAEQYAGNYRTFGNLGVPYDILVKRNAGFSQCYDDPTGCDQGSRFGVLSFNTAKHMQITLKTPLDPEDPNWEVKVSD